jgi:signal peptidase II
VSDILRSPFKNTTTFLFAAVLVLTISQISSYLVNASLAIGETHVINTFLFITHIRNIGGTFGAFPGHSVIFALISSAILLACTVFFFKSQPTKWVQFLFFGFIIGGGASNVLDRVLRGSVVDFINLQGIPYWNYIFNTADVFIHLGIWPSLLVSIVIARKEKRLGVGS